MRNCIIVLRYPNEIGRADWDGWVRERGLYFAAIGEPAYAPLLENVRFRRAAAVRRLVVALVAVAGMCRLRCVASSVQRVAPGSSAFGKPAARRHQELAVTIQFRTATEDLVSLMARAVHCAR